MPSTGDMARRVKRLERALPSNPRAQWRAYLAQCFAGPEYAEHREAIIEALCSDMPQYSFTGYAPDSPDEYTGYCVSWWMRDKGDPPLVRLYPGIWLDAIVGTGKSEGGRE